MSLNECVREIRVEPYEDNCLKISFRLAIHNEGPGIASDIFTICRLVSEPGPNCQIHFEAPDSTNWTGQLEFRQQLSMITTPSFRLPPGANTQPIVVHIDLAPPFKNELRLTGSVGAGQSKKYDFVIGNTAQNIEHQYNRFQSCQSTGHFEENEKHEIAGAIIQGFDS